MTTVNKNPCHQSAGAAPACKPRPHSDDVDAFSSCLKQKIEQCEEEDDRPGWCHPCEGKQRRHGKDQGDDDDQRDERGEKKKEAGQPAPKQDKCKPGTVPGQAKESSKESFADYVKGAMLDFAAEVQKRTGTLGNTTLKDPSAGNGKKLSMEELATQFGNDFVAGVVDYRMKEFYGQLPQQDGGSHKAPAKQPTSVHQPVETGMPRTPVPADLAVGEPGVPSKTGIQALDRWDPQFAAASRATGLPANYIKAVAWAQSRGNPNESSPNPDGKHSDLGVMQISDYTYGDVVKNQPRAPRGLHANNPEDNIMMGAWELRDKFGTYGNNQSYVKTSAAYRGVGDGRDTSYGNAVVRFWATINKGRKPSDSGPW